MRNPYKYWIFDKNITLFISSKMSKSKLHKERTVKKILSNQTASKNKTGNLPSESFGDRQQITTGSKAIIKELKFIALVIYN